MTQSSVAAAYSTGISGNKPSISQKSSDSCVVAHKELIANLSGSSTAAFTQLLQLALQPGLASSFPWLSNIAQNWQFYRFKRLRFCFYTRTGSTTVGSIVIVPDYNPADAAPSNEVIASSYEDVQEDVPWKDQCCVLRPLAMHGIGTKKLIRSGPLAANLDINQYDSGNLWVFSVDSAAAAIWGKLWVEYEVEFMTPQLLPGGVELNSVSTITTTAATTAAPLTGGILLGTGPIASFTAAGVVTLSNLVVGAEYIATYQSTGSAAFTASYGTLVGLTAFHVIQTANASSSATFTCTATVGAFTLTAATANPGATILVFAQIPVSAI
jgi:hypothetical protein